MMCTMRHVGPNPTKNNVKIANRIAVYLDGTSVKTLFMRLSEGGTSLFTITAYTEADYAADKLTRLQ